MPKFNKGDSVRVRVTSHSPYKGQIGVVENDPESYSSTSAGSSGFWYMVRFDWKGMHPAVRLMEEDLESPSDETAPEAASASGATRQATGSRIFGQPGMKKYYYTAVGVVLVIAIILVGLNINKNGGLPIKPGTSATPTLTPGLTEATTTTKLAFTTSLTEAKAGFDFPVQPVVNIVDAEGNIVADSTATVTLVVTDHRAVLFGTTTVNAVNGVATFTGLNIRSAGSNYSLTAISSGSTSVVSSSFNIVPGPAILLGFSSEPVNSGLDLKFTITVSVTDYYGNVVTDSTAEVTIGLDDNSIAAGAVLSGQTTQNAKNGVATFNYLSIDPVDGNYKLVATNPDMFPGTSASFNPVKIQTSTETQ